MTLDFHKSNPHMSVDQYVRARRISLGKSVLSRERIYLDTRFWILLRDADLGRPQSASTVELLKALKGRVRSGEIVCPIEPSIFLELLKQQDLVTRHATAGLIDELSGGVTLVTIEERIAQELCDATYAHLAHQNQYPVEQLVWSKLSYVFGVVHPTNTPFPGEDELAIQKTFFDHMWCQRLVDILDVLGDPPSLETEYDSIARSLNQSNAAHSDEIKSFERTYRTEYIGLLTLFSHIAGGILESLYEKQSGARAELTQEQKSESGERLLTIFADTITKRREVALTLRTIYIGALCHAAIRTDKQRKLTGNDLYDFHHAQAALGYCDAFFTDGPLQSLLCQKRMGLAEDFSCKVISSVTEADEWVRRAAA